MTSPPSPANLDDLLSAIAAGTLSPNPDFIEAYYHAHDKALVWSAERGRVDLIQDILTKINTDNASGRALHAAVVGQHFDAVKVLVQSRKAFPMFEYTFTHAAAAGCPEMIKLLLLHAHLRTCPYPALRAAAAAGHAQIVSILVPLTSKKDRNKALYWAAHAGRAQSVCQLIPVSDPNHDGHKALIAAAESGDVETIGELLKVSGFDKNPPDPKAEWNPLMAAASQGHLDAVRLLLTVFDPKANKCKALQSAAIGSATGVYDYSTLPTLGDTSEILGILPRHLDVVQELLPLSPDAEHILKEFGKDFHPKAFGIISAYLDRSELIEASQTKPQPTNRKSRLG